MTCFSIVAAFCFSPQLSWFPLGGFAGPSLPLAAAEAEVTAVNATEENAPLILAGVLLSLIVIYLASKGGGGTLCSHQFTPGIR